MNKDFQSLAIFMLLCIQLLTSKPLSVPFLVYFSVTNTQTGWSGRGKTHRLMPILINRTWKQEPKRSYKLSCIDSWWTELSSARSLEVRFGLCISWKRKRLRVGLSLPFISSKYESPAVLDLKCKGGGFQGTGGGECCYFIRISSCLQFYHTIFSFSFWGHYWATFRKGLCPSACVQCCTGVYCHGFQWGCSQFLIKYIYDLLMLNCMKFSLQQAAASTHTALQFLHSVTSFLAQPQSISCSQFGELLGSSAIS